MAEPISGGGNFLSQHFRSTIVDFMKLSLFLFFILLEFIIILKSQINNVPLYYHLVIIASFIVLLLYLFKSPAVYVADYVCYTPPSSCRVPFATFVEHLQLMGSFDGKSVGFMEKILRNSGLSEETYLPPGVFYLPPIMDHREAISEVHMVLFPIFEELLSRNGLCPKDIDILVVNSSRFCPDPSLSAIVVNHFCMREDVKSFNLTGMGCSGNTVAVDMVRNMMIAHPHRRCNAVVLSTEILTTGWYRGKERPFMVLNCIFRMGGAAVLLSNKLEAKNTAKYKLIWTLRTQGAFDDRRYNAAFRDEDAEGVTGMRLNGDVLHVAGETLQSHIPILGARFLPFTEIILFLVSALKKKFLDKSMEIYVPNFKSAIQHFCFPATGKSVVRETAKRLKLGEEDMEPALMTVYRYGNQSSASLWYELAYLEAKDRVKKGDRVWLLGMGTGPKCNSLVLQCIKPILSGTSKNPWDDFIHKYPVRVP